MAQTQKSAPQTAARFLNLATNARFKRLLLRARTNAKSCETLCFCGKHLLSHRALLRAVLHAALRLLLICHRLRWPLRPCAGTYEYANGELCLRQCGAPSGVRAFLIEACLPCVFIPSLGFTSILKSRL